MENAARMSIGIVGLGKMGGGIAEQALGKGFRVVGFDKLGAPRSLVRAGLIEAQTLAALASALECPRAILLYVPAGHIVDDLLDQLAIVLDAGDRIADGGNSYWGDSVRRHARLADEGIGFLDVGTSGGPGGARTGACFMVGGERTSVSGLEPILQELAEKGGYVHAGGPGAGHFVKLVHNGVEFGMLQAIGEGVDLLEHYRERLPIAQILSCWRHGSVIRSWLIELMEKVYREMGGVANVPPYIEDTGEVNWLVEDALHMEVPIPVITQAVVQLLISRDDKRNWARAIAMMRHGFGDHPYGVDAGIRRERQTGRIGCFIDGNRN